MPQDPQVISMGFNVSLFCIADERNYIYVGTAQFRPVGSLVSVAGSVFKCTVCGAAILVQLTQQDVTVK